MFNKFFIKSSVDLLNDRQISGWIFHRIQRNIPVTVLFFLDGIKIGETVANVFREDLRDHGLHPDGHCGFAFNLPPTVDLDRSEILTLRCGIANNLLHTINTRQIPRVFREVPPKIFFMHIPKTAGTSFYTFAQLRYPVGSFHAHLEAVNPSFYHGLAGQKDCLAGHLRLQTIREHFDLSLFSLYTIIREPYAHLHSHLNWARGVGVQPESSFYQKHPACIQELGIRLNRKKTQIKNLLISFVDNLNGFELDFFDNCQTRYFLDYRPERVTATDFENALNNLKIFKGIGITEKYDQFIRQFCENHNSRYISQEVPLNRSRHAHLYDINNSEMKSIVQPLVAWDLCNSTRLS